MKNLALKIISKVKRSKFNTIEYALSIVDYSYFDNKAEIKKLIISNWN